MMGTYMIMVATALTLISAVGYNQALRTSVASTMYIVCTRMATLTSTTMLVGIPAESSPGVINDSHACYVNSAGDIGSGYYGVWQDSCGWNHCPNKSHHSLSAR